jgi:hypothetical protein
MTTQPAFRPTSAGLEPHFKTLGVDSIVSYKLWCNRNCLDTSTEKTPGQLQTEIHLFKSQNPNKEPDIHRRHNPRLAKYIARIFKGKLQNDKLSHIPSHIRTMYNRLKNKPEVQQALCRLILHIEKYSDHHKTTSHRQHLSPPLAPIPCFYAHVDGTRRLITRIKKQRISLSQLI